MIATNLQTEINSYFKKYALYNSIEWIFSFCIVFAIGFTAVSSGEKFGWLLIVACGLILIFQILHLLYKKNKLTNFIAKINAGEQFEVIDTRLSYQLKTPNFLSYKNEKKDQWKFLPIQMIEFTQLSNSKNITIPVSTKAQSILLNYISGDKENKSTKDIWQNNSNETSGLATWESWKEFIEKNYSAELKKIATLQVQETSKSSIRIQSLLWLVGFAGTGFYIYSWYKKNTAFVGEWIGIILVGVFLLFCLIMSIYAYFAKRNDKKTNNAKSIQYKILPHIIKGLNASFVYRAQSFLSKNELMASGIFKKAKYIIEGDSQIIGNYKMVNFQLSNIYITAPDTFGNNNSDDEIDILCGNCFVASFNKKFTGHTLITASKNNQSTDIQFFIDQTKFGIEVRLEDPEFTKLFKVYSTDQIEARYILTTTFMQYIKNICQKYNGEFYISFTNNTIYIFNNNEDGFANNAGYISSIDEYKTFYDELSNQLSCIDDLRLNQQINWN